MTDKPATFDGISSLTGGDDCVRSGASASMCAVDVTVQPPNAGETCDLLRRSDASAIIALTAGAPSQVFFTTIGFADIYTFYSLSCDRSGATVDVAFHFTNKGT